MSLTLGEKLRQAREAKGIMIGEVAEQTRISPLYIESIENDDYRALPGGIFNRGFVKSFAKYVGVDEQEALSDYARLLYETEGDVENVKFHRPEVLTDDRTSSSMLPTLIVAAVILGIMTVGVLFALRQFQSAEPSANLATPRPINSAETNTAIEAESSPTPASGVPDMETLTVEFTAVGQSVALSATIDGKTTNNTITPGSTTMFEPKGSIKLSYSKWVADFAKLAINGKNIILPKSPLNPKRANIEFEINNENLAQIWTSGEIKTDVAASNPGSNANTESSAVAATPPVRNPVVPPRQNVPPITDGKPPAANRLTTTPKPSGTVKTSIPARPPANTR
jgi:cytoskeletal protein RodZ